ncbi:hypothetical protein ABZ351_06230 [Streptomyces microflavus]|uniref:hypothetical protein n=1 Tax=Streptomyces microflavus TaxID=1919 RepID=UPI0033F2ACDC
MKLVKAFNNINVNHIPALARPADASDRTALPISGDDAEAKAGATTLIRLLGFDTVDAGGLAEIWHFEPESASFAVPYFADPARAKASWDEAREAVRPGRPLDDFTPYMDAGAPLPAHRMRTLLAETPRALGADQSR